MTVVAVLLVLLLAGALVALAAWGIGQLRTLDERRYGHALTEREVADHLRPHPEPIAISPAHAPVLREEER